MFVCCSNEEPEALVKLESPHAESVLNADASEEVAETIQSFSAKAAEPPIEPSPAPAEKAEQAASEPEPAAAAVASPVVAGPSAGQVYTVDLEKVGGKFGAMLDLHVKDYAIITSISPGSSIERWNASCEPNKVVQVGDRLLSVGGTGGDNPKLLALLMNSPSSLQVQLRRPMTISVSLPASAHKKVGLRLPITTAVENVLGCEILGIVPDSRITAWNDQAESTQVIKVDDRVFKVDGERLDGQDVQNALKAKAASALELTFLSWQ